MRWTRRNLWLSAALLSFLIGGSELSNIPGIGAFGSATAKTAPATRASNQTTGTGRGVAGRDSMPRQAVRREELAHEFLDFETARQALIAMAQASNDPKLKEALPMLSSPPDRDRPGESLLVVVSRPWDVDLRDKSWSTVFGTPRTGVLRYFGDFYKDEGGHWVAHLDGHSQSMP
jgi:hypothetical protein